MKTNRVLGSFFLMIFTLAALSLVAQQAPVPPVSGESILRPILPMTTSKAKEHRFRNAPDGSETS